VCLVVAVSGAEAQSGGAPELNGAHMRTTLEKTFLKIDVLSLDLCLDSAAAVRIRALMTQPDEEAADSIARAAIEANEALGRIRFLRDIGYGQFLDGIAEEQRNAVKTGLLDDSTHVAVRASLPEWFSFLENRDIKEGDEIVYHIRGDTIRTTYLDARGIVLMDRRDNGPSRRRSVLVTWLAPGSGFRDGLLESLRKPAAAAGACRPAPGLETGAGGDE
jgi:hypothetical protein